MRLDPIAQQLLAPVSTRGESTCGRSEAKEHLLFWHENGPPDFALCSSDAPSEDPPQGALWIGQIPNPGGVILEKLVFRFRA